MSKTSNKWFVRVRLKTRQCLLLIALDEERNIHRAAEVLNMTQPAASKQIKDLEEMLEVKLFDRLPRGMRPTLYGETVIRHARMSLGSLARAHEEILALKSGLAGHVNVGVIMTPGMTLVPQAIVKVKQHSPSLRIGVQVESSNILLERLQQGALDFLVARIFEQDDKTNLQYEELTEEPVCVVARIGHPLNDADDLGLRDIAGAGWLMSPPGSVLRHRFEMMFRRDGLEPPTNMIDTTAILVVIGVLQQTDYLHVMPIDVARYFAQLGTVSILPIDLPCKMDAFGIITRRDQVLSPGAALLHRAIKEIAGEIYSAKPHAETPLAVEIAA
ncbi:MAG: LysR family transcriptional regulator [Pseudomonadota bacterium]